jgi:ABC-type Mn2+/Zn2+ transport system permease subunit
MIRSMVMAALIATVCAALSCFVTLKGWSLMGDALAHAVVPGVALAYLAGVPFALGAFGAGMLAAMTMGFVKRSSRIREDAVIGIVFTTFFAAGLLLISLRPAGFSLKTIWQGNILGISDGDIVQMVAIALGTALVLVLRWRDLVLFLFDPAQARAIGLSTTGLHLLLLTMMAATAVAALQTVGACLVVAMLVTPGATAYLLTDRFGVMMAIAMGLGFASAAVGSYASYFLDASMGGCIVVLQTLAFFAALTLAPKHGIIAARVSARRAMAEELGTTGGVT